MGLVEKRNFSEEKKSFLEEKLGFSEESFLEEIFFLFRGIPLKSQFYYPNFFSIFNAKKHFHSV